MNLPDKNFKVKVGPHTYEVIYSSDITYHGNYIGRCDITQLSIFLKPDMPKSVQEETFVHEVLHAVIDMAGLSRRLDKEDKEVRSIPSSEEIVNEVAPLLYLVIKDNPKIFC